MLICLKTIDFCIILDILIDEIYRFDRIIKILPVADKRGISGIQGEGGRGTPPEKND